MARISELHFSNDFIHPSGVEDFIEITLDQLDDPSQYIVSCYRGDGSVCAEIPLNDVAVITSHTVQNMQAMVISASRYPILFAPNEQRRQVAAVALTDLQTAHVIAFFDTHANRAPVVATEGAAAGAMSRRSPLTQLLDNAAFFDADHAPSNPTPIAKVRTTGGLACFAKGTRIRTGVGNQLIETLKEGDLIWTRDNGLVPLEWIASRTLPARSRFAPIQIAFETFGAFRPHLVAADHLILLTGWRAELIYGEEEILVPAKALVDNCDVRISEASQITYYHLAFETPQIVSGDGVLSQCFHPDAQTDVHCAQAGRAEMFAHFPELATKVHVYGRNRHANTKTSLGPLMVRSG